MTINEVLVLLMFASFVAMLFSGFPVGYVLAGIGVWFTLVGWAADMWFGAATGLDYLTLGLVVNRIYSGIMENWILVALPLFIFMGCMLQRSGVAERMMESFQALFGGLHGGLAVAVIAVGMILAASTGIIGASVVLLTVMALPIMMQQKYATPLATGTIASAGTLGILLPPSIMLILMADQMGLAVGDLFVGAIYPGLILGGLYMAYIVILGLLQPDKMPLPPTARKVDAQVLLSALKSTLPAVLLMVAVLGSIFAGIATPTEASGVGAAGAALLAMYYGRFNLTALRETTMETYKTSANIFVIFIGATCFALVLRELGGDAVIEDALASLPFEKYGVVIFILFIVFLLGFVLDWIEITLIILPLMGPVVASLGFGFDGYGAVDFPDLLWFVVLVAITLQTSFLTPPVGFALFYMKGAAPKSIKITDIYRGVLPFVIIQISVIAMVLANEDLVIKLPAQVYGN